MLFQSQITDIKAWLPWNRIRSEKMALRELDLQKRRIMTHEEVLESSHQIIAQIEKMSCFRNAQTIMVYYPIQNEVDLRSMVKQHADEKTFLLPVSLSDRQIEVRTYVKGSPLIKGKFGIPEPSTPAYDGPIDLIIVPGVAFDKHLRRLGRGGGYYDRFLKRYRKSMIIGVCYDFQLHANVPHQNFDMKMDRIVTPSQSIGV